MSAQWVFFFATGTPLLIKLNYLFIDASTVFVLKGEVYSSHYKNIMALFVIAQSKAFQVANGTALHLAGSNNLILTAHMNILSV